MIGMTDQNKPKRYSIQGQSMYTDKSGHSERRVKKCSNCKHEKKYQCTHPDEGTSKFKALKEEECFEKKVFMKGHF